MFHRGHKREMNDAEKFMRRNEIERERTGFGSGFGKSGSGNSGFGFDDHKSHGHGGQQQQQQNFNQNQNSLGMQSPYVPGVGLVGQPAIGGGGMYGGGGYGGGYGGGGYGGYNPFPFLNPAYQATLYLIGPAKHIDLSREGSNEVAIDDTGRRLFNMVYSQVPVGGPMQPVGPMGPPMGPGQPPPPMVVAPNMFRLNIIDFQGNVLVHADYPGAGGNASIWVGDRVIGTATIGRDLNSLMITTSTPGSRNCFGFDGFGMEIKVYRMSSEEVGRRSRGHFHHHFSDSSTTVATLEAHPIKFGVDFCIEFTDPQLDVEGKVLILAIAQHVKTVKDGRAGGGGRGGFGGTGCCTIL